MRRLGTPRGFGIRAKMVTAVVAVAVMMLLAVVSTWLSYRMIEERLASITSETFPAITTALRLAEATARMATSGPELEAAEKAQQQQGLAMRLSQDAVSLSNLVVEFEKRWPVEDDVERLWELHDEILATQDRLSGMIAERLEVLSKYRAETGAFSDNYAMFRNAIAPLIEEAGAELGRALEDSDGDPARVEELLDRLTLLQRISSQGHSLLGLVSNALAARDETEILGLQEQFSAHAVEIFALTGILPQTERYRGLDRLGIGITGPGIGGDNLFALARDDLIVEGGISEAFRSTRRQVLEMSATVSQLVHAAELNAAGQTLNVESMIQDGRREMLIIAAATILGPVLFLWFFVGRGIVNRIGALAESSRRVAEGDRDTPIERDGTDEIGDMSEALGIFRNAMIQAEDRAEEIRKSERALAAQSELLQVVLDSIGQGLWAFGPDLKLVAWNRQVLDLLEYPDEMARAGKLFTEFVDYDIARGALEPDDPSALRVQQLERALSRKPHKFEERRSGDRFIEVQGGPMPGGGFVSTVTDVTVRRAAEAELREAKESAEKALSGLQTAQRHLVESEKMVALGSLVAGVAHEINTPVGTTLTAATQLSRKTELIRARFDSGEITRQDFADYVANTTELTGLMVANIERAAELIQSFKQVSADQTSAERRRFDLGIYIREVVQSLGPRLNKTRHRVTIDCPAGITMNGYPGALSQVLTNFVMNSLMHAYKPDESGHLSITVNQPAPGMVSLRYADDGRGIPSGDTKRIFEPFFTTRRGAGGTGLGLNVTHNLVHQWLRGTINVESNPNKGTVFEVMLPTNIPAEVTPASLAS